MSKAKPHISILFVIDGIEFGGGERTFLQLIQGLSCVEYDIYVATSPQGDFFNFLKEMGIKVASLDVKKRVNINNIKKLSGIIRERKIDVLHSQGARADFYGRVAARMAKTKVRVVNTVAMPVKGYDVGMLRKGAYRFFDWISERYVDRFIVVSEILRKTLTGSHRIPPNKVIKIYNGIEFDKYSTNGEEASKQKSEVRRELGLEKDAPVIGAIGRMVWQKGFKYLIEAVPQIAEAIPQSRFLIVGEGPLRRELEILTRELRVEDRLIFTGFRNDIGDVLGAIDAIAIPSLLEGFPMVTLEAMAMAKPTVATNIDGITEQITAGVDGILVPPRDPAALANAIVKLVRDKEASKKMGLAAREKVEQKFSVEKMLAETEKVYADLLRN